MSPPAWAKSILPPPPFPFNIKDEFLTNFLASNLSVISSVIPIIIETFSSLIEINTIIELLLILFWLSINWLKEFFGYFTAFK